MTSPPTEAQAQSRRGRFPDPSASYAIALTELRRAVRRTRQQDVWLLMVGIGTLATILVLPIVFGVAYQWGEVARTTGDLSGTNFSLGYVFAWLGPMVLGLFNGLTSDGDIEDREPLLTIRPVKDIAGGLLAHVLLVNGLFVLVPTLVAAAGFTSGVNAPVAALGMLLVIPCLVIPGVPIGYGVGLLLKGVIRRSPWLSRLKPVFAALLVVGYFWLAFTGRLYVVLTELGPALEATPLYWVGDLAVLTTPGVEGSVRNAVTVGVGSFLLGTVAVLAVVHAAAYAWSVEKTGNTPQPDSTTRNRRTVAGRLDRVLGLVGIHPATRGVAVATLLRGYRAPLQLVYVAIPLVFALPALEAIVRTGVVPGWMSWMVVLYGAWAAGVGFPLNVLGNQGATLPRLLTSPTTGRRIVRGYALATSIVFVPVTVTLGVLAGIVAGQPARAVVAIAVFGGGAVVVGTLIASGIGVTFPRFSTIDLTDTTRTVLPSKFAFVVFSTVAVLTVTAVGVLADEQYRAFVGARLSESLPIAEVVSGEALFHAGTIVAVGSVVAAVLAYRHTAHRIDTFHVS